MNALAGMPVRVSPETIALVQRALDGVRLTNGRFDPTVLGAVVRAGYDRTYAEIVPGAAADDERGSAPRGSRSISRSSCDFPSRPGRSRHGWEVARGARPGSTPDPRGAEPPLVVSRGAWNDLGVGAVVAGTHHGAEDRRVEAPVGESDTVERALDQLIVSGETRTGMPANAFIRLTSLVGRNLLQSASSCSIRSRPRSTAADAARADRATAIRWTSVPIARKRASARMGSGHRRGREGRGCRGCRPLVGRREGR